MYYNNANNNTEKTTEHANTVLEGRELEQVSVLLDAIIKPRSKALNKLRDYLVLPSDDGINEEQKAEIRLSIAKALWKNADVYEVFSCVYEVSYALKKHAETITRTAEKIKAEEGKKPSSKAVVDNATLDYALSLVNGTVSRAKGTAESLKQAALWLAYYKDAANPMEYTAVDSALNKVFAAVRRQAKKNAEAISAKSNKVTKDAVKLAVMERIREMQANHEYAFEVLIGEA